MGVHFGRLAQFVPQQHLNIPQDRARQARLEQLGVRFLRFTDRQVKQEMTTCCDDNVLREVEMWVLGQ